MPVFGYFWAGQKYRSCKVLKPVLRREAVYSCREKRAFSEIKIFRNQRASGIFQNPQLQPHILFSSRRKENVPLTVQEKRAAGGAVKGRFALPRTPC